MCMFCAAIPATLAVGANAHVRQRRQQKQAEMNEKSVDEVAGQPADETAGRTKPPASALTAIVVAGLVVASVIYHTQ